MSNMISRMIIQYARGVIDERLNKLDGNDPPAQSRLTENSTLIARHTFLARSHGSQAMYDLPLLEDHASEAQKPYERALWIQEFLSCRYSTYEIWLISGISTCRQLYVHNLEICISLSCYKLIQFMPWT